MSDDKKRKGSSNNAPKVTIETYGHITNVNESQRQCWMLRTPHKLAEAWEQAEEGSVIGELVFVKGGGATNNGKKTKPQLLVQVNPQLAEQQATVKTEQGSSKRSSSANSSLPLHYSLAAMTKKVPLLHPFSRTTQDGSIHIHGTVTRQANLQVTQDANYRQLCKNRILQSTVHNARYVKPTTATSVSFAANALSNDTTTTTATNNNNKRKREEDTPRKKSSSSFGSAVHDYGKSLLDAAAEAAAHSQRTKRQQFEDQFKDDDLSTRSILFELFSQQRYWTFKDLKLASGNRPEPDIREALREIGTYHRLGDHRNFWELRQEFQQAAKESGGPPDGKKKKTSP